MRPALFVTWLSARSGDTLLKDPDLIHISPKCGHPLWEKNDTSDNSLGLLWGKRESNNERGKKGTGT